MAKQKEALVFKSTFDESETERDPYIEKLEDLNINCHSVKSLDFEYCNISQLTEKLENSHNYEGIIFSSPRCVTAVEKCSLDLGKWKNKRSFVVGEKTGENVYQKFGFTPEGQSSGNSANLVSYILNQNIERSLLLPCGDLSRDTLYDSLTRKSVPVDKVVVYKTIPDSNLETKIKNIVSTHKISFIVCFSPSSVNLCLPILRRNGINLSMVEWIAIGPTTENCLIQHKLKIGCVAEKPTPDSLAKAIKEFLG